MKNAIIMFKVLSSMFYVQSSMFKVLCQIQCSNVERYFNVERRTLNIERFLFLLPVSFIRDPIIRTPELSSCFLTIAKDPTFVYPFATTIITASERLEIKRASPVFKKDGVSIMTTSYISFIEETISFVSCHPKSSTGFGGLVPEGRI